MDWVAVLAVSTLLGGLFFGLLLAAFCIGLGASLRKRMDDTTARQLQTCRSLADNIGHLQRELQEANAQIRTLAQANRRLSEEVDAMGERLADGPGAERAGARARLLH
ncbi:MAG TPA: hypothetical protein VEB20_03605 [Azospirillaceae bacterium]|nr:hypothetical protein [Azospirillaceae bacterium]